MRHGYWGRLFGDRYKSVLVEGAGYYYETLLDYIHLNPVRARMVNPQGGQSVLDYAWSSVAGGHALPASSRPRWLGSEVVLTAFGFKDSIAGRRGWVGRLDERARAEAVEKCGVPSLNKNQDARRSDLRRGWYWGSQIFADQALKWGATALTKPRSRDANASLERQSHGEMKARELMAEGMAIAGLTEEDLDVLPGSEPRKVAIATVLWDQTTVDLPWIAEHLKMRSAANASQQIRRQRKRPAALNRSLQRWASQSKNAA